jgi:hypothetical protein
MATRTKGPWNHRKCAEHRKVEGYTAKVCVLPGQNGDEVEHFAAVMYRLAKAFRRRIFKPATKKRAFNMHDLCGGHAPFPGMGKLCYGDRRMSASDLAAAKENALTFAKEIAQIRETMPRYARFYSSTVWS